MKKLIIFSAAVILCAGTASAQLEVVTNIPGGGPQGQPEDAACVHDGQYAMRVTSLPGNNDRHFVEADETNGFDNESVLRVQFWFKAGQPLFMAHREKHFIGAAMMSASLPPGPRPFQVMHAFSIRNGHQVWVQAARNNATDRVVTDKVDITAGAYNLIQVEWEHNQVGMSDASCTISIIDGPDAGQSGTVTNFRNTQYTVGRYRMGLTGSVATSTDGIMCFDSFASFRTLAP
jgi:hypothetical protein